MKSSYENDALLFITHRPGMLKIIDRLLGIDDGPKAQVLVML
jgi:ABC-type transport system involved in cytochrome bd biosynthesis fused ATPase/permease subunit